MFSYYGSKSKIAHLYPPPTHDVIVEPFAGSARYSLLHWERDVLLLDANPIVVAVWEYLMSASEQDILSLPDVPSKVHLDEYKSLSDAERWLIGFHLCRGKAKPRKVGHGQNSWSRDKKRIASDLHKIRHWSVRQGRYYHALNNEATWFIDPPYINTQRRKGNSDKYPYGSDIDYDSLAVWSQHRWGQVIVCEGDGADWLPFKLLKTVSVNTNANTVKKVREMIWVSDEMEREVSESNFRLVGGGWTPKHY